MHMLSSFGRCYMGRVKRRFSFNLVVAPSKGGCLCPLRCLALQLQKAISFKALADLGEFYVKSKGFPCSTWKSSDFGRMDEEKRGPFFLMWGLFRAKNTEMALLVTWGTGFGPTEDSYAMLSSFGRCYMGKNESPFKFNFVSSPRQSWLFVPVFAVLPSNFKRPYLFNRSADLGEFYVKSKGFPCSTWKSSDFGRMDEKRGGLSSSCGAFQGLKIPGMALLGTWGTGLRPRARFVCHVVLIR